MKDELPSTMANRPRRQGSPTLLGPEGTDRPEPALDPPLLGGRYRVVRHIATGGMATVYVAEHTLIGRQVAIKVLHPQYAADAGCVQRFLAEGRTAGTLGHPHIVASTDMGYTAGGAPFLVLELLEGQNLNDVIRQHGPMAIARAVAIAQQIASALAAAHARGVIHRDLKSGNVFLLEREAGHDHAKVLDFGISKFTEAPGHTQKQGVMGTPWFMPPEQIEDPSAVDARCDIYGLGVILYEMLTGDVPFAESPFPMVLSRIRWEEPAALGSLRPEVGPELAALVHRAMAKSPADRIQSMEALGRALAAISGRTWPELPARGSAPGPLAGEAVPADDQPTIARGTPGAAALHAPRGPRPIALPLMAPIARGPMTPARGLPAPGRSGPRPPAAPGSRGRRAAWFVVAAVAAGALAFTAFHLTRSRMAAPDQLAAVAEPEPARAVAPPADTTPDQSRERTVAESREEDPAPATERAPSRPSRAHGSRRARHRARARKERASRPPEPEAEEEIAAEEEPEPAPEPEPPEPEPPEPVRPRPPAARGPAPGTMDRDATRRAVRRHLREVKTCFERGRMDNAQLSGRVLVRIAVAPSGKVTSASIAHSSLRSQVVESCIVSAVTSWTLPAPAGGVAAAITYPFTYR